MDAAIQTENRNVTVSLLVSVSLNTSTKDKRACPGGACRPCPSTGREELCTHSMQSTQQGIHIATGALGAVG
jgi:hypothetical protein